MQKYFTNTTQSKFIKSLMYNTPLPTMQTVRVGDFIIEGFQYILRKQIILCTKSGYVGQNARYVPQQEYIFGNYYSKFTYRYLSDKGYYDTTTHVVLGEYLRCLRDQTDIDLMPYYNCFPNTFMSGLRIVSGIVVTTVTSAYKVALIPIKLNQTYTIAIDSTANISMAPAFINGNTLVSYKKDEKENDLTARICSYDYQNSKQYSSLSFKSPISYKINVEYISKEDLNLFKQYEHFLYLVIQIPTSNNSSLTVLEGDYTNQRSKKVFNAEYISDISKREQNSLMLNQLYLLQMNDTQQTPYSPRLIEYLLWNVVNDEDPYWKNVHRIQKSINYPDTYAPMKGVWNDILRKKIYDTVNNTTRVRKLDVNGYLDKDAENMYVKGWNND